MAGLHEVALYAGLKPFAPPKPALSFADFGACDPFLLTAAGTGFSCVCETAHPSLFRAGVRTFCAAFQRGRNGAKAGVFSAGMAGSKDKTRNREGIGKGMGRTGAPLQPGDVYQRVRPDPRPVRQNAGRQSARLPAGPLLLQRQGSVKRRR